VAPSGAELDTGALSHFVSLLQIHIVHFPELQIPITIQSQSYRQPIPDSQQEHLGVRKNHCWQQLWDAPDAHFSSTLPP